MSFGTLHLGRAVADFMERYPQLQIQLVLSDQLIDPVQEGFDVTLRIAGSCPWAWCNCASPAGLAG
jgi:DNA-binding transcriptional LysR family regulator